MFKYYNPNPKRYQVGDCAVRALTLALNKSWDDVHHEICDTSFEMCNMPSSNAVWGVVLRRHGFRCYAMPYDLPEFYTVADFARDNPRGVFVLCLSSHVVTVIDGDWYDTWDSSSEIPIYYFTEV